MLALPCRECQGLRVVNDDIRSRAGYAQSFLHYHKHLYPSASHGIVTPNAMPSFVNLMHAAQGLLGQLQRCEFLFLSPYVQALQNSMLTMLNLQSYARNPVRRHPLMYRMISSSVTLSQDLRVADTPHDAVVSSTTSPVARRTNESSRNGTIFAPGFATGSGAVSTRRSQSPNTRRFSGKMPNAVPMARVMSDHDRRAGFSRCRILGNSTSVESISTTTIPALSTGIHEACCVALAKTVAQSTRGTHPWQNGHLSHGLAGLHDHWQVFILIPEPCSFHA